MKVSLADFWKQFPNSNFVSAGRSAYRADIHIQNNPYKINGKPYCDLWDKGYRLERRRWEGPPVTHHAQPGTSEAVPAKIATEHPNRSARPHNAPRRFPNHGTDRQDRPRHMRPPQKPQTPARVVVLKPKVAVPSPYQQPDFARFNQKHRTAA